MLALLAAAAAADALHATGTRLPRRPAAATAAVIPWALVLIGFGLLLCLLRQARLRRAAAAGAPARRVPGPASPAADLASDLAIDAEPGHDDPASDEAGPGDPPDIARVPGARAEQPAGPGRDGDLAAWVFSPAPTPAVETPGAAVDGGPGSGAVDAGDPGLAADLGSGPEAGARLTAEVPQVVPAEPVAAETGAAAEPAPQFDRMRSSPVPPEA
jgi:hypothetical protein